LRELLFSDETVDFMRLLSVSQTVFDDEIKIVHGGSVKGKAANIDRNFAEVMMEFLSPFKLSILFAKTKMV